MENTKRCNVIRLICQSGTSGLVFIFESKFDLAVCCLFFFFLSPRKRVREHLGAEFPLSWSFGELHLFTLTDNKLSSHQFLFHSIGTFLWCRADRILDALICVILEQNLKSFRASCSYCKKRKEKKRGKKR